ncbi:PLP-dependent aspartate aminotransferase family protein [Deltaproteobacteria bacterium]|nr:PLP-dependent aspartate aminotransferase family protein [Deltaproteobacteria bacterium]
MGVLIMDEGESTRSVHAAMDPEEVTGSVQPPIFQTSTYVQEDFSVHKGYEYARTHNPTREALEKAMAELESPNTPATGICFGSGMAAITAVSQLLSSGDHIIACDDLYGGTVRLFDQVLSRYGIETTYSKLSEGEIEKIAQENTKVLWLESPTNPLLSIHDIKQLSSQAKARGWIVVVDNTFASPVLQRPLDLGADIVLHSTTKYIGGHSDVVGGCVIMRDKELIERLKFLQNAAGAVPGPFDCFLTLRGIRTLALRMERHCDNAEEITERLTKRTEVTRILYPGLISHPNHHVATSQMRRFGGMISIEIEGGETAARKFAAALKLFSTAESLGGVESLINHPWTMTHAAIPEQQRRNAGMTPGLVRLSVGIEDIEDLWADIVQALQISSQ